MKKIIEGIRHNTLLVLGILIIIGFIAYGFYDYIHMYYGFNYDRLLESYEMQVERCKSGVTTNKDVCDNLKYPLTPLEEFKLLDAKTLFYKIVYEHSGGFLQLLLPFLVMIIFLSITHKEFSSGMVRNNLMRESFFKYKMRINKKILKVSFVIPLFIFLIFIISCILTRFNFNVDPGVYGTGIYIKWNYDNIFLYMILNYIIIVLVCIFYCNVACCFINKNKNIFIVSIAAYITWFVIVYIVNTYGLYLNPPYPINKFMNILDFWDIYDALSKCWYGYIVSAGILALGSFLVKEIILRNKEKVIIENEKGII